MSKVMIRLSAIGAMLIAALYASPTMANVFNAKPAVFAEVISSSKKSPHYIDIKHHKDGKGKRKARRKLKNPVPYADKKHRRRYHKHRRGYKHHRRWRSRRDGFDAKDAIGIIGGIIITEAIRQERRNDFERCDDRYRTFRYSDGTFQPYGGGPRKLCPYLR